MTPALTPAAGNAPDDVPDLPLQQRFTGRKRLAVALVAVALPLGAAACSSSSTPTASTATHTITHTAKTKHKKAGIPGVVTGVTGTSLTVSTHKGGTSTFTLSSTTHYHDNGTTASAASLAIGQHVIVHLMKGSTTTAAAVAIVASSVGGTVNQISSTGFTMHTAKGTIITVSTSSTTTYESKHATTTAASLAPGDHVRVFGPPNAAGSITATKVDISKAHSTAGG
ncbi:MAG: DUF5666 domain-containing protein [Acidimicrobiales bacterium]